MAAMLEAVLVKTDPSVGLCYAALDAVPVRAPSWVIWRWLWDPACWVTARSTLSLCFGIEPRA